jgi:SET domain-containing protein
MFLPLFTIKDTQKYGRGIFANRDIKKGELLEMCPVIITPKEEEEYLSQTVLANYCFYWGENERAIALGYASLFNHSYSPNAGFYCNTKHLVICFNAIRDIRSGEEITINYNGEPDDTSELWFEVLE